MIFCRILGPIEIEVDGSSVDLGGPVPRRLLTALASTGGVPVSNFVLAELVWDAEPGEETVNAIRVVVHRLRTALGARGRGCLESAPGGYRLAVAAESTDHGEFVRLIEQGRKALGDGDAAGGAALLESALALWRGTPWTELGESVHVAGIRARLNELRAVAVEELQAARLATGDTARAIAELSEAVIELPFRERRWELLALGLYRTGRQAQALAELRRVRGMLIDELGVEPGPALQDLEQRMLAHDPDLLPPQPLPRPESAPVAVEARPVISPPRTRFVGRRQESILLHDMVSESRLTTIVGPGGVGKTRLAIEYAAGKADAWLVRLADTREPAAIAPGIAAAVGLTQIATDSPAAIARALGDRPGLLVLDNCEHLLDDLTETVLILLAGCPQLRILATSRQPTGIEGEQLLVLSPLDVDDERGAAVELFLDRTRAHRVGWQPGPADLTAARAVCAALDGLPLAIELAAARTRSIGLADLAERLRERLDVLGRTPHGSISPHASLDAAIGWSIDQLPATDREFLLRLWPFEGGFDWQAAQSVRDPSADGATFAGLAALVDRSVLTADVITGHARYRLLETIRRYCRQLDTDPESSLAAHAAWVRHYITEQVSLMAGPRLPEAVRSLTGELPNLRAGIAHDLEHAPLQALRSTGALAYLWVSAGVVPEGARLLHAALTACPDAPDVDRARACVALSLTSAHTGSPQRALDYAEAALALLDDTDPAHDVLLLEAHLRRCNALADLGRTAELREAATAFADACARRDAPPYLRAAALWGIGVVAFQDGHHARAVATLTRAHEISARSGFTSGAGITDLLLAWCLLAAEDDGPATVRDALNLLVRAVNSFEQQPNFSDELAAVLAGAYGLARIGVTDTANRLYAAVAAHAERLGTDPFRYLGFAGPELVEQVRRTFGPTPLTGPAPEWPEMIILFITSVADLPA